MSIPQRYQASQGRYRGRGGLIRLPDDMRGFITDPDNRNDMARFYFFCLTFDQIVTEGIEGDFAELGVYRGHTANLLATMARRTGSTAYLLDTFNGFASADLKGVDADMPFGYGDTSLDAVRALVGEQNVRFVPGHFPSSVTQLPDDLTFSLVHLDCDLYAPMASALAWFYPRLVAGGFLIAHDYGSLHWPGAERAVDEFFATKAESVIPVPDSGGSIVVRKAAEASRFRNWYVRRNANLIGSEWTPAAKGTLSAILGEGWSGPEDWGVWGIDERHQLFVFLSSPPDQDIALEFDVSAVLLGDNADRAYEVFAGGEKVRDWSFTAGQNRSVRTVTIPRNHLPTGESDLPSILVEFRPAAVAAASGLAANGGDQRRLGLALHRVRRTA